MYSTLQQWILSKLIFSFKATRIRTSIGHSVEFEKLILKCMWNPAGVVQWLSIDP